MLGIAKTRQRVSPPEDATDIADVVLQDAEGRDVRVGDLWRDRPAVLVFLRHYGCTFCRAHAVQLHRDRDRFEAAGARLVAIGQGTPAHAREFLRSQKVEGLTLLVDPNRRTYEAAGTKVATFGELLGPRVVLKGVKRTLADGVRQGRIIGHPAQLGGVLVVAPGGKVTYAYLSDDAGDLPPNEPVLEAAKAAASR
ncbi:MAG: AhpC/TSA family protein [Thermoleophilaceae bacterium]|nr:AhpC/TSA family protein [Thermoleophilaceae bacterium]